MQLSLPINALKAASSGFSTRGGTLTSSLTLFRNPEQPLEATTKAYVDAAVISIPATTLDNGILSTQRFPQFIGDVVKALGGDQLALGNTGVSAGAYGKVNIDTKGRVTAGYALTGDDVPSFSWSKINTNLPVSLSGYGIDDAVAKTGDVLTGFLNLNYGPSQSLHAANKEYADNVFASNSSVSVGDMVLRPTIVTPEGFLQCNGGQVSKTTYSALYAVIGDLYTTLGSVQAGAGQPWKSQYNINTTDVGTLNTWTGETALPIGLSYTQFIITKNRVYSLGGWTSGNSGINTVYTAPINSDGTLGAWTNSANNLAVGVGSAAVFMIKNRVYLLGGTDSAGNPLNTVQYAAINLDGTLSTWVHVTTNPLPSSYHGGSAFVTNNRVYLVGGQSNGTYGGVVYTAAMNEDGSIGAWFEGPTIPASTGTSDTVVTNNRVYVLGGNSGGIFTATIDSNGVIGSWSLVGSSPTQAYGARVITTRNRVYMIGGDAGGTPVIATYYATINTDGTLGAWTQGSNFPIGLGDAGAIVTSSRLYILGGRNPNPISNVYSTPISGSLNDYTSYYDGTITSIDPNNFRLPDLSNKDPNGMKYFIKY